jgi:predicted RND superfamily exporter protein
MIRWIAHNFLHHRYKVVGVVWVLALALAAAAAMRLIVSTKNEDLLPTNHPYIKVHKQFEDQFGGPNLVVIMLTVEKGTIFEPKALAKIKAITEKLQYVDAVNQYQIVSLASKKLKDIRASTYGIETIPLMWPDLPKNAEEIERLRKAVLASPLAYGTYVSKDLKSALITVDFIGRLIEGNYPKVSNQIKKIIAEEEEPGYQFALSGQPIMIGDAYELQAETMTFALVIIAVMAVVLFLTMRTWRGTVLPMLTAFISAATSLGTISLLGINFDPLIIVIVFLITARAISHSVQFCAAFDDERELGESSSIEAARKTFIKLFRPSVLSLVVDIGGILAVMVTPIPLLQKAALVGAIWLTSLFISAVVLIPTQLSWTKKAHHVYDMKIDTTRFLTMVCKACATLVVGRVRSIVVLLLALAAFMGAVFEATKIPIGDTKVGSPLFWPDHQFNRDTAMINSKFPGSDQLIIVPSGAPDTLKQPIVLDNMLRLQRRAEALPQIGSSVSIIDVIEPVNRSLHEGNPRFAELGKDAMNNGELAFMYLQGSDPGDMDQFADPSFSHGAVRFFFKDHKGDTIRAAMSQIKQFIEETKPEMQKANAEYQLAGGIIGIMAAVNEVIFGDQVTTIAYAILVLFVCCAISYQSAAAGLFFLPLIMLSNALTFAFMTYEGIGLNVNTLPIAALGIGLGVDYAFYVVDRVKERYAETFDLPHSIRFALMTAGRGVLITGITMVTSVALWGFSSLRFNAEMGILIGLWMTISAIAAMLVIPAMIYVFKPSFVIGGSSEEKSIR